ncbi:extracellular solute-binding protein [Diplocloster agilis]|uniref:Extracellular solute-binding protein n=1 Tax=Diplocloster agilis TaxID=2850323 RepID=A0A949NHX4_9FIRM|nr:extracellular solute-binding protein [Diplocloster agilis]MBU9736796.1 extracellular solute-binding protein [Diplocloster agilis]MBU9736815.1 extracellular solute-binding protein [Diplocloster agilis]
MKAKKVLSVLLAVTLTVMLAACGSGQSQEVAPKAEGGAAGSQEEQPGEKKPAGQENASDEDKVITFWNITTGDPDKAIMNYAVDQFNQNSSSGYQTEVVAVQNDNYKEKLIIAMSSGECPDMYTSWTGGPMIEYIESGFAQPLDDLFYKSDLPNRLTEGSIAQGTYNGHIYAIPVNNVSVTGIFYNKEIFDKYNLQVPETIGQLESVCDTLLGNGITPFALANQEKWTGSQYFMYLATRYGGLDAFTSAADGTGSFEDECFIKAGETIKNWVKKGYFPEGVNSLSWNDGMAKQLFYQENAAMMLTGSGMSSVFMNDSEEFFNKLGWFPFPVAEGVDTDPTLMIGTMGDQFISFNCTGEKLEAAFECVTNYSTPEGAQFMVDKGKIPPVKGIEEKVSNPLLKTVIEYANKASNVQLYYDQYLPPAVAQVHLNTMQEVFGLTMEPAEAAKQMQKANQDYLAEK